jgi:hypothetical protein
MPTRTKSNAYNMYRSIRGKASSMWQDGGKYAMSTNDMLAITRIVDKYMKKYFNE